MNTIDTQTKRPTHAQIAARAYELFVQRGGAHGSDVDDWLRAERELLAAAAASNAVKTSAPVSAREETAVPIKAPAANGTAGKQKTGARQKKKSLG